MVTTAHGHDHQLLAQRRSRAARLGNLALHRRIFGRQEADAHGARHRFPQRFHLLGRERAVGRDEHAADVAAGPRQAVHQTGGDRIEVAEEDDRRRRRRIGRSARRRQAHGEQRVTALLHQFACQRRQPRRMAIGPAPLDLQVLPLDPARALECRGDAQRLEVSRPGRVGPQPAELEDLARRLRRGGPPRGQQAQPGAPGEGGDALAPPHSITSSARKRSGGGSASPKCRAVPRLSTSS